VRRVVRATLAALALLGAGAAAAAPPAFPDDDALRADLRLRIEVQHRGSGAVLALVTPDDVRVVAYGTPRAGGTASVGGDTVFGAQSLTKVLTALLLADMVDRGEVAPDDPVARFLPGWRLPEKDGRAITLADLATHTSGLPLRPGNLAHADAENRYDGYTVGQLRDFLAGYVLPSVPGERYEYSNVGYGLLGQALCARLHMDYARALATRVTGPLGMTHTTLGRPARGTVATGYTLEGAEVPGRERGALDAAGAVYTTAADLARLLRAAFTPGPLAGAFERLLSVRRTGGQWPANATALGWNVWRFDGREVVYKNGSGHGYRTFMGFDPAARRGVVGLINAAPEIGLDDVGLHLLGAPMPVDRHVPRPHVEVAIDRSLLDRYVGRYRFAPDDVMVVTREGEGLVAEMSSGDRVRLWPEGERDFFVKEADAQVTFGEPVDGVATTAVWHQFGEDQTGRREP
jgi:CubicO group peptidase (beta-lactamase class C family)